MEFKGSVLNEEKSVILGLVPIILICTFCVLWIERDKTTNISDYNKYFGNEGEHINDEDFISETERLAKLNSSKDYLIYGATGFNYPVIAIQADNSGYIYALNDKENNRLIYVEITFVIILLI